MSPKELALAILISLPLLSGCAAIRQGLGREVVKVGEEAAKQAAPAILDGANKIARARFDEKWKPVTGFGFDDYDVDKDGYLNAQEYVVAVNDFKEKSGGMPGLNDLLLVLAGAGPPAYMARKWLVKKAAARAGEEVVKKEAEGQEV